jgi:hypothetical protein
MASPATQPARGTGGRHAEGQGYGLVLFASVLLVIIGCFNAGEQGRAGMRTRATGRAGQRQARSPRSCGPSQCAWSSGGVPQSGRLGDLPAALARRRGNLILSRQPQTAASRLSRDLGLAPGGIFGPEHPGGPPCDRRPERING